MKIKKCGSFVHVDDNGFLIKIADKKLIQKKWIPLINRVIEFYKQNCEDLISVFIRGSVAKGIAVDRVSDLDSFCITRSKFNIEKNIIEKFKNKTLKEYPFSNGIEIWGFDLDSLKKPGKNKPISVCHEMIKTQSVCYWGKDFSDELPNVTLDLMYAHSHLLDRDIEKFKLETVSSDEKKVIFEYCSWIMKRIVRVGFEMYMEKERKWTRDLYLCYETFSKYNPNASELMYSCLDLALNPTDDKGKILQLISEIRPYLALKVLDR